jgi:hypothetical protein
MELFVLDTATDLQQRYPCLSDANDKDFFDNNGYLFSNRSPCSVDESLGLMQYGSWDGQSFLEIGKRMKRDAAQCYLLSSSP